MNAPETSLPSKRDLLDFQDTWQRRAGAAALAGGFLAAGGLLYQRAGLTQPNANSNADQLAFFHAHSGRLTLSFVIQGIGFALFAIPLVFLFKAASGRAERMRNAFTALVVLGPLAFGLGFAVYAIRHLQGGGRLRQAAARHCPARSPAGAGGAGAPETRAKGGKGRATATTTGATTTTGTSTTGTTTTAAKPKTPDQAASDAREGLADHLNKHTAC